MIHVFREKDFCQRPYSIRTRIKTHARACARRCTDRVRDHIPLEQGLRLVTGSTAATPWTSQRPYSIRTRIKTLEVLSSRPHGYRQRPYSIRTRIKTRSLKRKRPASSVRDHIPLEQGLRLEILLTWITPYMVSETIFH